MDIILKYLVGCRYLDALVIQSVSQLMFECVRVVGCYLALEIADFHLMPVLVGRGGELWLQGHLGEALGVQEGLHLAADRVIDVLILTRGIYFIHHITAIYIAKKVCSNDNYSIPN